MPHLRDVMKFLDSENTPSWKKDGEWRYVDANDAAMRLIFGPRGFTRETLIGKKDTEVWPPEFIDRVHALDTSGAVMIADFKVPGHDKHYNLFKFEITDNPIVKWAGYLVEQDA